MIKAEQIKQIINSLEFYKGPKLDFKQLYNHLHDAYYEVTYTPYCKSCSGCGHDGCCSAAHCNFGRDCKYKETYLADLKYGYWNAKDIHDLIYDYGNKDLLDKANAIYDKNYDLIYKNK